MELKRLVCAVSEDTGKVLDVVYLTRECQKCKEMEEKQATGELSRIDFLSTLEINLVFPRTHVLFSI
jgi:hypothetical protein